MSIFSAISSFDKKFCPVFPQGITSLTSALSNLPIILLFILTIPIRTFLCILSSITEIPLYGVIANLLPPSTLLCSLTYGSSNVCYPNCPYCQNSSECLQIPNQLTTFCSNARPYFSIPNQIFCLIGYILIVLFIPLSEFINIFLALVGKQLCISANPNLCNAVTTS